MWVASLQMAHYELHLCFQVEIVEDQDQPLTYGSYILHGNVGLRMYENGGLYEYVKMEACIDQNALCLWTRGISN